MKPLKEIGDTFPTIFNLKEMRDSNAKAYQGIDYIDTLYAW